MTTRAHAPGFTLLEVVIATAIGTLVALAAVVLLLAQERAFRAGSDDRALQETGRMALEDVATNLRMAGYGVDPAMAFDFGQLANAPMDRAPGGVAVTVTGYACATPVLCRDSAAAPDELVFLSRDPFFNHPVIGAPSATSITLQGPLNVPLHRGQILHLACQTGALEWAFVTVGAEVPVTAGATFSVALASGSGTSFPLQNAWLTRPCFQGGAVSALKVDRFRYFIGTYTDAGAVQAWGAAGARPFLMLDQGLTDANGGAIQAVVAPDVEDLQVTYLFPAAQAPAATAVPATAGTQLTNAAGGVDLAPAAGVPTYASPQNDPTRQTNHPSNIRAVRVAVVVRSATPRPIVGSDADNQLPAAGNRPAAAAPAAGYRHMLFETTSAPRNMGASTPYIPANSVSAGADNLNVGGG